MRRIRRTGFTLVEMLIVGLISTLVGVGLWTLVRSAYDSQFEIVNQNMALGNARQAADTVIDDVRLCAALSAATASDVSFSDNSGNVTRYWRASDSTLRKTVNGSPSGGTVVTLGIQTLSFTYWTYNGSAWTSSTAPASPSGVGAVDLTVTANSNGFTSTLLNSVKLVQHRDSNADGF